MVNVKQKLTTVSPSDTRSIEHEVYRVAFGALVACALIVGVVAFASLGVGVAKVLIAALA